MIQKRIMPTFLVGTAILPLLYIVVPLFHMLSAVSWQQLISTLLNSEVDQSIGVSLLAATITTLASLVFGLPIAFLLSLRNFAGKRLIKAFLILPLVLPPVVGGIAQLFLYGPEAVIGNWFAGHGIMLTNSVIGVVLAQTYITSPFMILSAKAGFEEIPQELKEVTRTLGGGLWHIFWYVCVPLARSAILSGAVLTFARAIGEFGATMIMAYHPYTLPVDIWVQFISDGFQEILPIAAIITACAIVVMVVGSLLVRKLIRP